VLEPEAGGDAAENGSRGASEHLARGVIGSGREAGDAGGLDVDGEAQVDAGLATEGDDLAGNEVFEKADVGRVHAVAGIAKDAVVEGVGGDEDLGVGVESSPWEAELAEIDKEIKRGGGAIEGATEVRKGKAAGDFDHVGGLATEAAAGEAVVEELHLGEAIVSAGRDYVPWKGEDLDVLGERVLVGGDALETGKVGTGVF